MTKSEIVVVDTGVANRHSVRNALEYIDCEVTVTHDPSTILRASKLVFPGVGSFVSGMKTITERDLLEPLTEAVLQRGIPILGICLGFQMMAKSSEEDGHHSGLGWVPGRVTKLVPESSKTKIPHVGFNDVACKPEARLFQTLPDNRDFYFLHSYRMEIEDQYVSATCDYSGRFVAAIEHGNIMGTQFHPEKSQSTGLQLLQNFATWNAG